MNKKIVVTGAAGYIGCILVPKLLEAGYEVLALDKCIFPSGAEYIENLVEKFPDRLKLIKIDLRNIKGSGVLSGYDVVIHLAGLSNDPQAAFAPKTNIAYNVTATRYLVHEANEAGIKRFMFASSASVYGFSNRVGLTEAEPLNPQSYYASSKWEGEKIVLNEFNGERIIFRQATLMGSSPRFRTDLVIQSMFYSAVQYGVINVHGGGEASRPLIDIEDIADTYIEVLKHKDWSSFQAAPIFNLAHTRNAEEGNGLGGYRIGSLALWVKKIIEEELFIDVEVIGDWSVREGRSYDISCDKLHDVLNIYPSRTAKYSVEKLCEQYRNDSAGMRAMMNSPESKNIVWTKVLHHAEEIMLRDGMIA